MRECTFFVGKITGSIIFLRQFDNISDEGEPFIVTSNEKSTSLK